MTAPWVSLIQKQGLHSGTTFTFCTVGRHHSPQARTCVFRDWLFHDPTTQVLLFTTDSRMSKVSQLLEDDRFEACFYFSETNHQFRLQGRCRFLRNKENRTDQVVPEFYQYNTVGNANMNDPRDICPEQWSQEYRRVWDLLSPGMQQSFKKPPPGTELTPERQKLLDDVYSRTDDIPISEAQSNFLVMLMFVNTVDTVDVTGIGSRTVYQWNMYTKEWTQRDVCP